MMTEERRELFKAPTEIREHLQALSPRGADVQVSGWALDEDEGYLADFNPVEFQWKEVEDWEAQPK
jgi:hypothetical protein